jgi:hypothetical protein
MKKVLPLIFVLLTLMSCNNPVSTSLENKSPDGKTLISIKADKENPLMPFTVNMNVKSGDIPEGGLQFEIGAKVLDDSNVKFDWSDNQTCVISFTQGDGDVRKFDLKVSDSNVLLQEAKKP